LFGDMSGDLAGNVLPLGSYQLSIAPSNQPGLILNFKMVTAPTVNQKPTIQLNGAGEVSIGIGQAYVELNASAYDPEDGNITDGIVVGGNTVDTSMEGVYVVTYNVVDSNGLAADTATRTVTVVDMPPAITLIGANPQELTLGEPYIELGATASDDVDGDISGNIATD
ncbi:DUF5011 domain-containing protein, partial [Confluentibacter lentus]|uniref:DUF5011 domain-containing protein n=1 Tax=Confluentibacter lentus TaxID=1699412 RepID=UPI0018E26180